MSGDQLELEAVRLEHIPVRAPRDGHIGEQVFYEKWLELMARPAPTWEDAQAPMLNEILRHHRKRVPGQREATVAATFAVWLGCNMGSSIVYDGRQIRKHAGKAADCYLMAWTCANRRYNWLNGGGRTIEYMLAPDDHYGLIFPVGRGLSKIPDLTADDVEAMDQLFGWLGSGDGEAFLVEAEAEIQRRQAEAYRAERQHINDVLGVVT